MHDTFAPESLLTDTTIIATRKSIAADLRELGLLPGDVACIHVSLKAIGLVIGGPRTLIEAVLDVVTGAGSMMMPAFSGDLSDPGEWRHPPVPADRVEEIRRQIPPYDAARTPSRGVGVVAEYFRTWPGVRRSPHPQSSFAAFGHQAEILTENHPFDFRFGPASPLGRLTALGGKVLLIGAPYDTVSLFHMTQHLVGENDMVDKAAPVIEKGERRWVGYRDVEYPVDWFAAGVEALIAEGLAGTGAIGGAHSVLIPADTSVQFLVEWRRRHGHVPQSG